MLASKKIKLVLLLGLLVLLIASGASAARQYNAKLSIVAKPKITKLGSSLIIKGRLVNSSRRALRGKKVVLQRRDVRRVIKKINGKKRRVKQRYWRSLKKAGTNRKGIYRFRIKPRKSAIYRVRYFQSRKVLVSRSISNRIVRIQRKIITPIPLTTSPIIKVPVVTEPTVTTPMSDRLGFAVGNTLVWQSDQELANRLDNMASLKVKWIRHDMPWDVIQPDNSTTYNWSPYDRLITEANKRNIKILPILTYTPTWARLSSAKNSPKSAPANPDQFASFAASAARRYAPLGVRAWEIWNEPNHGYFWQPAANVTAYTTLLKKTYVSIKQVDPSATVVSGGLTPATTAGGNIAPRDFVSGMYANGVRGYFDVLGHHPYNDMALPSEYYGWSAWSQMAETSPSLRSIMANYNDSKPIWGTEYGKPTAVKPGVNESFQAQAIENAAQEMKENPWLEKLFIYSYKDIGTSTDTAENFFGVIRYDGSYKPAYYSIRNILLSN